MRDSKKFILIVIIILTVLILLGGGIFAYTYFFTDTFLSNQQRFYKYIGENAEIASFFKDENLENYLQKQKNESYSNNGEFTIGLSGDIDEETKKITDEIQKHKITFTGSIDSNSKYFYQDVRLKYNERDIVGGTFIRKDDYIGLMVNNIIKMFITFENNNLKQFAKNMGLTDEQIANIPDKIDLENLKNEIPFTEQELNELKDRYLKVLTDNLTEDMFSESEQDEMDVYTLTITEDNATVIMSSLIETLKNDEMLMNKMKQLYMEQQNVTEEEAQVMIDSLKTSLDEAKNEINGTSSNTYNYSSDEFNNELDGDTSNIYNDSNSIQPDMVKTENTNESENLYINLYVSKRSLVKTEIFLEEQGKIILNNNDNKVSLEIAVPNNTNDSNLDVNEYTENQTTETTYKTARIFSIEKNRTDNELSYIYAITEINDGQNKERLKANATYTGLSDMTNVGVNLLIDIYNYPNDSILLKSQNASNDLKNETEKEKVSIGLSEIITKYYEDTYISLTEFEINETTIKQYMDKQGLDTTVSKNEDGTYKILSNTTGNIYTVDSQGKLTNTEFAETVTNAEETEEKVIIASLSLKNNITFGTIQQQELNENNMYKINDKSLEQLQSLFTQLGERTLNKATQEYSNTVIGQIITQGTEVNNSTTDDINSTSSNLSEQEKSVFNAKFTAYEGDYIAALQVNSLIQAVISSNQSEIDGTKHYIKIKFPSTSGVTQEINVKDNKVTYTDSNANNKVKEGKTYKVNLKYNDNGYINEITVKEK